MNEADILLSQIDGVGFCGSKFPEVECARWVESPICTPCEIYGRNFEKQRCFKEKLRRTTNENMLSTLHVSLSISSANVPSSTSSTWRAGGGIASSSTVCAFATGAKLLELTSMSCTPPRTYTRSRNLTAPTTCLSAVAVKTRRKRKRSGRGDEELSGGGDDKNKFGGGGGGDDGGNDNNDWREDSGGEFSDFASDMVVLWSLFCVTSFAQMVAELARTKPPAPVFATVSVASSNA